MNIWDAPRASCFAPEEVEGELKMNSHEDAFIKTDLRKDDSVVYGRSADIYYRKNDGIECEAVVKRRLWSTSNVASGNDPASNRSTGRWREKDNASLRGGVVTEQHQGQKNLRNKNDVGGDGTAVPLQSQRLRGMRYRYKKQEQDFSHAGMELTSPHTESDLKQSMQKACDAMNAEDASRKLNERSARTTTQKPYRRHADELEILDRRSHSPTPSISSLKRTKLNPAGSETAMDCKHEERAANLASSEADLEVKIPRNFASDTHFEELGNASVKSQRTYATSETAQRNVEGPSRKADGDPFGRRSQVPEASTADKILLLKHNTQTFVIPGGKLIGMLEEDSASDGWIDEADLKEKVKQRKMCSTDALSGIGSDRRVVPAQKEIDDSNGYDQTEIVDGSSGSIQIEAQSSVRDVEAENLVIPPLMRRRKDVTLPATRVKGRSEVNKYNELPAGSPTDAHVLNWVQCEACKKWRRLPPDVLPDSLPEEWYCTMNRWDPRYAVCSADEEDAGNAAESQHPYFQKENYSVERAGYHAMEAIGAALTEAIKKSNSGVLRSGHSKAMDTTETDEEESHESRYQGDTWPAHGAGKNPQSYTSGRSFEAVASPRVADSINNQRRFPSEFIERNPDSMKVTVLKVLQERFDSHSMGSRMMIYSPEDAANAFEVVNLRCNTVMLKPVESQKIESNGMEEKQKRKDNVFSFFKPTVAAMEGNCVAFEFVGRIPCHNDAPSSEDESDQDYSADALSLLRQTVNFCSILEGQIPISLPKTREEMTPLACCQPFVSAMNTIPVEKPFFVMDVNEVVGRCNESKTAVDEEPSAHMNYANEQVDSAYIRMRENDAAFRAEAPELQ